MTYETEVTRGESQVVQARIIDCCDPTSLVKEDG